MQCPFCQRPFSKWEIDLWHSFACPKCHKWIRVRRNYPARILRLFLVAVLTAAALYLAGLREETLERAVVFTVVPVAAVAEEAFLHLLPAKIESAAPDLLDLS